MENENNAIVNSMEEAVKVSNGKQIAVIGIAVGVIGLGALVINKLRKRKSESVVDEFEYDNIIEEE